MPAACSSPLAHMIFAPPASASHAPAALFRRCLRACRQGRRLHALCQSDFDAWIADNPLPGRQRPPSNSDEGRGAAAATATGGSHPGYSALRFGWDETPAVAARLIDRYSMCRWSLHSPGLLAAHDVGGSGPPIAKLALPRLLAGNSCCSSLWASSSAAEASPLTVLPEAEEQQLRQALEALAVFDADCSRSEPFSIGSQLLVLLSADSAALAMYSEGHLVRHKVHTGYTVRRQQGKAQATYERQGGGETGWGAAGQAGFERWVVAVSAPLHSHSLQLVADCVPLSALRCLFALCPTAAGARSVGASIRARETRRLFQAAAATLADWEADIAGCSLLFRSGSGAAVAGAVGTRWLGKLTERVRHGCLPPKLNCSAVR